MKKLGFLGPSPKTTDDKLLLNTKRAISYRSHRLNHSRVNELAYQEKQWIPRLSTRSGLLCRLHLRMRFLKGAKYVAR